MASGFDCPSTNPIDIVPPRPSPICPWQFWSPSPIFFAPNKGPPASHRPPSSELYSVVPPEESPKLRPQGTQSCALGWDFPWFPWCRFTYWWVYIVIYIYIYMYHIYVLYIYDTQWARVKRQIIDLPEWECIFLDLPSSHSDCWFPLFSAKNMWVGMGWDWYICSQIYVYTPNSTSPHTDTHLYFSIFASSKSVPGQCLPVSFFPNLCNFNLSLNGNLPVLRWSNGPYTNFHTSSTGSFKPQICATFCGSHGSIKFAWLPPK